VKEDRNAAKLAALSSQYNAAADAQQQGFGNMVQGMAGTAASTGVLLTQVKLILELCCSYKRAANRAFSKELK
jgi:hypothetical protein